MMISCVALGLILSGARADEPLLRVDLALDSHVGYIVPESYAEKHKAVVVASIPGVDPIDGFWTPTEQDVAVADRALRDSIEAGVKAPALLFPDLAPNPDFAAPINPEAALALEHERKELVLVLSNYDSYTRQFVGIIVAVPGTDAQTGAGTVTDIRLVFCNYSVGTKVDPSTDYILIQKVFVSDGTVHFLQGRFDPLLKTCSKISMIGPWVPQGK